MGEDRPPSITRVPKKSDERAINIAPSIKAYSKGAKFSGFRCDTYEYVPTATKPANTNNENPAYMASMFWIVACLRCAVMSSGDSDVFVVPPALISVICPELRPKVGDGVNR